MNAGQGARAPFVGLRPFDRGDHQWFRGRARETAALTRQVRSSRFTAVVGASGSGKSSLVRAGVLVALVNEGWVPIITKPGSAPIARLAAALADQARDADEDWVAEARRYRFGATLRGSAYGLAEIVKKLAPATARLVLVVDQFEELFRYGEEARDLQKAALREETRAFVELLLTAASLAGDRLHVVITMRSDYFGNCAAYAGLAEAVSASQFLVPLPSRDQLEEAIRGPVEDAGGRIADALVQRLLVDVEEQVDPLPLFQHTLRRLWDAAEGEPRYLDEEHYVRVRGLVGSIDHTASEVAGALRAENPQDGRALERVMKALTALDEHDRVTRRPQKRSELLTLLADGSAGGSLAASLDRILEAFAGEATSFLRVGEGEDPEIDIGHEALIRGWKSLAGEQLDFATGWIREEREDGEEWRGLVRRAEAGWRLTLGDQRRVARWLKRGGFGPAWSERYGDAWDLVAAMRRQSARVTRMKGAVLCAAAIALAGVGAHQIRARMKAQAQVAQHQAAVLQHARASALAAAIAAHSYVDRGESRVGALIALAAVPKSRSADDPRHMPEVATALVYALSKPIELVRLGGHAENVRSVTFSPIGRRLAWASGDRMRLWNAETGQPIGRPLVGHTGRVIGVAFSPDGGRLASASEDGTIRLWDAQTGEPFGQPLTGHGGAVWNVAFAPDGQRLASASADETVRLWDAESGQPIGQPLRGHRGAVWSVAFSPDGRRLATASADETVRLWNASTGQPIGEPLKGHRGAVRSVAFSPDSRKIASGSADETVRLWDAESGQPIDKPLKGHRGAVWSVAFSPDGRELASASDDETLLFWDVATGEPIGKPLQGHQGAVLGVAFSPDGRWLASAGTPGRLWQLRVLDRVLSGHGGPVLGIALSPDGRRLASASEDRTIRLWDAESGQLIGQPLVGHTGRVIGVAFSPTDGRRLASASEDKTIRLWDAESGQPIGQPLEGHHEAVRSVAFSPDGRQLASASVDGTVRLWNAHTGQPVGQPLEGHQGPVWSVAFSPDGRQLASASEDRTLRVWDATTAQLIAGPLRGHEDRVIGVAFSPTDGRRLASASDDKTVRFWDAHTGEPIGQPLKGHTASVFGVAFSPDGRRLASASADKTLRVWDAMTAQLIAGPLRGHEDRVIGVVVSRDGRLASASSDRTVRLWDTPPLLLSELAAKAETLCPLSRAERERLHLLDPQFTGQDPELSDGQRRACGNLFIDR